MAPPAVYVALLSNPGRARTNNEDACLVLPECGLFAVADGIGGRPGGALAARLVVSLLPGFFVAELDRPEMESAGPDAPTWGDALANAVRRLNGEVLRRALAYPSLSGLGATVVSLLLLDRTAHLVHLGDSRAYLQRGGRLIRLTLDHTMERLLVHYAGQEPCATPETSTVPLAEGDRLLLCSDGLTHMVPDTRIEELLDLVRDPNEACHALIAEANRAGGLDNVSVIVVDVGQHRRQRNVAARLLTARGRIARLLRTALIQGSADTASVYADSPKSPSGLLT
jgi:protein phosphatase